MESIRWTASTNENGDYDGKVGVKLTGLNSGYIYKLQLLVRENCCLNRGYDVTFKNGSSDVVTIKEDFSTVNNLSPSPVDYSQVISHSFESSGTSVIITLDGLVTSFGDKNPILNALTLEQIDTSNNTDGIGTLTVTGGQINAGSIFTNGTLLVTNSDNSSITGAISDGVNSAAILTKAGAGTLTLSGTNTYSGDTTINAGTIKLTGAVNTATDLIIASGATLDLQSTQTFATLDLDGTISRSAGSSALTITGASDLGGSITTSGSQTYTGAVTLTANTTLTSTADAISASTIDGGYSLTINSAAAQSLTSAIGSSTALTSINVSTTSGNLTLGDDITVTSTGTDAMIFNAGSSTAAGTSTGGNIIISGSPTFTTGSGGRMTYYTGSISGSTGLTSLIGSGSHRFRYNSDETTTNYSAALSSGKYAIYREQPTLTITADNETVTYSTAPSESVTITGTQNGDASATVVTTAASISIGGDTSTSNNYIVGGHTITPSAAASTYGYGFSYSTGTLTVDAKALTIAGITASNKTYNGNATATIDASAATFTGLVDGDAVTVSATGTFDNKNVGTNKTVTLTETNAGDDVGNYSITDQGTTTANITAKTLTATASASNKVYDGTTTATATLTLSGLVGSETLGQSVGATFADQNVNTGIVVTVNSITLSDGDNGGVASNYSISTGQTTTANITAKDLTITANNGSATYGTAFTVGAGSENFTSSGLVNSETIGTITIASDDGATNTSSVGTYNIVPSAATDGTFTASNYNITYANGTLTVAAKDLTITANNGSATYGTAFTVGAGSENFTSSGLVNSETIGTITIASDDGATNTSSVGTYNIVPSAATDGTFTASNYNITYANGTLTVAAKDLTITANNGSATYGTAFTVGAGSENFTSSGLVNSETIGTITIASDDGATNTSSVGTYNIVPSAATDGTFTASNYNITYANGTLTVAAKDLTITANNGSATYGTAFTVGAGSENFTSSGLVNSETIGTITIASDDGATNTSSVGTYNIVPSAATDGTFTASNYNITYANGTLTVAAKDLTITANNGSATYGTAFTVGAGSENFTSSGLVNSETIGTITIASDDGATNTSSVGTYNIVPSAATDGTFTASNYNITYANGTLTVAAKDLTITANNGSATYGTAFTVGAGSENFTSSGLVNSETIGTITIASDDGATNTSSVGTYNIVPSAATDGTFTASNYNITYANGTLTVAAKDLTITANNGSATYGTAFTVGAGSENFTSSGLVNSETIGTITIASDDGATNTSSVGTYNIVPSAATDGTFTASNYNITYANGTLTVAAKDLTITANNGSATYGTAFTVGAGSENFTSSGLVNSETIGTITIASDDGATNTSSVGTYNIVPSAATDGTFTASNYNITYANGTLTVAAKDLTITANNGSATYGTAFTVGAGSENFTSSGLVNSETIGTITIASDDGATNTSSVGTYNIVPSAATDGTFTASNYNITYANGTLTVAAKDLTITANNGSATYGTAFTVGAGSENFTSSGLVNSETIGTITIASDDGATNTSSVGTYNIVPSAATDGTFTASNYNITYANGTLTVAAKDLTITASASNKVYDGNTTAAVTLTFTGLVGSETLGQSVGATFADKNVANAKTVTVNSITLSDGDNGGVASNYSIATGQTTTANITQLSSVTWNGNAGDGLWSSAANWVGSAIPDLNNVATAVIPSAQSVTFDSDTVGTIGSTITNNGTLTFNGATNYTFGQVISGSGALVKINTNTLTLSATNTYSGDTTISAGTIKLTGAVNAATDLIIASGATLDLQSTQTFASLDLDGTISRSTGSSELTITGTSDIGGSITTSGTQDYEGAVTVTGNSTLTTTSAQITFDTTVNSETGETNNLTITASEVQFDGIVGGTRTLGVIEYHWIFRSKCSHY
jgi:autotransporter-associated beta strand protein